MISGSEKLCLFLREQWIPLCRSAVPGRSRPEMNSPESKWEMVMRTLWPDETLERRPEDSHTSRWYRLGKRSS